MRKKKFLFLTVFITGMAVMAVELTASRLLAPAFGTSLFVWTNLIGVVLLALSLGYYLGGKLADRNGGHQAAKRLYALILITGLLVCLIPMVAKPIFLLSYQAMPPGDFSIFFPSLIATIVLFTAPLLLLGMVAPLAARIGFKKMDTAGSVVGSLYSFSTVGSLVGTFLPVLLTVPYLGSRETFFIFGAVLILLGILGLQRPILLVLAAVPALLFFLSSAPPLSSKVEFEGESVYQYVRIQKKITRLKDDFEEVRVLLLNEGLGAQSIYHPSRVLTGYYWDGVALLPLIHPQGKNFLIVGLAGGTSARILSHFFPKLNLEGVEIDPLLIQLGKKYFGLDQVPIKMVEADGRVYLERTPNQYDFIMVDVFRDSFYIPFHLATQEFFETVKSHLTAKGTLIMNVFSPQLDSKMLDLLKNTVKEVFPFVYEYRLTKDKTSLLLAFREEPDFKAAAAGEIPKELKDMAAKFFAQVKPVKKNSALGLSLDNHSLIEFLSAKILFMNLSQIYASPESKK